MNIEPDSKDFFRTLVINFAIELVIYGILVVGYFFVVLRFLETFLTDLFQNNQIYYAFLGLGLVVGQGILLEMVTSFILDWLKLDRLE